MVQSSSPLAVSQDDGRWKKPFSKMGAIKPNKRSFAAAAANSNQCRGGQQQHPDKLISRWIQPSNKQEAIASIPAFIYQLKLYWERTYDQIGSNNLARWNRPTLVCLTHQWLTFYSPEETPNQSTASSLDGVGYVHSKHQKYYLSIFLAMRGALKLSI